MEKYAVTYLTYGLKYNFFKKQLFNLYLDIQYLLCIHINKVRIYKHI